MDLPEAGRLLTAHGIEATPHRREVLLVVADGPHPLQAQEILDRLRETGINRVTLYRILDLLVERGLVWRHSGGDRTLRYCLASGRPGDIPCHFYCTRCGRMACLSHRGLALDMERMTPSVAGFIEGGELRIDGVCKTCQKDFHS